MGRNKTIFDKLRQLTLYVQHRFDAVRKKAVGWIQKNTGHADTESVTATRMPRKSNLFAYLAVGAAAIFALSFFSGQKVPEPDRSNLSEEKGIVTYKVPASFTGVRADILEAEEEVGAANAEPSTVAAAPDRAAPTAEGVATVDAAVAGEESVDVVTVPTSATGSDSDLTPATGAVAQADDETSKPSSTAKPDEILVGTSAEGARLPLMFSAAATDDVPVEGVQPLMVPVETTSDDVEKRETAEIEPSEVSSEPDQESLQLLADRGDPDAMFELAMRYAGDSDAETQKIRFRYMQAAAQRGSVPAMREVAGLHERGEGVLASTRMAYVWSTIATAFGEDMTDFRERLAAKMSVEEMESAQRAAAATLRGFGTGPLEKAKAYKASVTVPKSMDKHPFTTERPLRRSPNSAESD